MVLQMANRRRRRCAWAGVSPLDIEYHDSEWGVPSRDDRHLFEQLILEGAQAGLSWTTILNKRENYRAAYRGFDPATVARFTIRSQARLLKDAGIVRNRLKVKSSVENAKAFLAVQREFGSFAAFGWSFVGNKPIRNNRSTLGEVPAETDESRALSAALKSRGFRFVGPTICYAFMQAVGMVNDHEVRCFRRNQVSRSQ
jgi:DNA-3-methyladenine glycosylase I